MPVDLPTSLLSVEDADEDNVEGYATGGAPVAIASIDTGVQMDHPEFGGGERVINVMLKIVWVTASWAIVTSVQRRSRWVTWAGSSSSRDSR